MTSDASFQWIGQTPNPFAHDVVPAFDECAGDDSASVNLHAAILGRCQRVVADLSESGGAIVRPGEPARTIMIGAPRAGYGKTHLVGRLTSQTSDTASVVPMVFDVSEKVNWQNLLRRVLRHFETTAVSTSASDSLWQETGRRLYAEVFLSASQTGDLNDEAPAVDSSMLRRDFRTDLAPSDEADGGTRLREWILENSHRLTELAADDVCGRWHIESQALPLWMAAFRRSALEDVSSDERSAILRSLMPGAEDADAEVQAKARLGELLRVASACRPVVLVIDHLDGFFGDREVALPLANTIASLRGMVRRGLMLLCMNRDVWESIFEGALPSALTDRLNGEPAALGSISGQQARDIVEKRLQLAGVAAAQATDFVRRLADGENWDDPESNGLYPRGVLRRASATWETLAETSEEVEEAKAVDIGTSVPPIKVTPPEPVKTAPAPPKPAEIRADSGPVLLPMVGATDSSETLPAPTDREPSRSAEPVAAQRFHPAPRASSTDEVREAGDGGPMKDLQSIVSDIRSGGAWAVSEGPSPADLKMVAKAREAAVAPARASAAAGTMNGSGLSGASPARDAARPAPSTAREVSANEAELRQRVAAFRIQSAQASLPWVPVKLERLVSEVGARFSTVAQSCPQIGGQTCLQWTVREQDVLMGFAPVEDDGYWKRLAVRRAAGKDGKLVAFVTGDTTGRPDFGSSAEGHADVIELKDDDLALLYAGDDMIAGSSAENIEERVRFVARRMDPFWRRVTRVM